MLYILVIGLIVVLANLFTRVKILEKDMKKLQSKNSVQQDSQTTRSTEASVHALPQTPVNSQSNVPVPTAEQQAYENVPPVKHIPIPDTALVSEQHSDETVPLRAVSQVPVPQPPQKTSAVPVPVPQTPVPAPEQPAESHIAPAPVLPPIEKTAQVAYTKIPAGPTLLERFMSWLKEDFLVKLGGFLLLTSVGWFVSYAVSNDWISEGGRIALSVLFGVAVMGLGEWRIRKYPHQGSIFLVLGLGMVLLSIWAGREMYGLLHPTVALIVIFIPTVYVAAASIRYNNTPLALSGLTVAMIAPWFTLVDQTAVLSFFSYTTVVIAGTVWVVYYTGWRMLTPVALLLLFINSAQYFSQDLADFERNAAVVFFSVFTLVFFTTNLVSMFYNRNIVGKMHLVTALGTGAYVIIWILATVQDSWETTFLLAWAVVFSLGAYFVFQKTPYRQPFTIYAGTGLILLATATANEFSGGGLVIAYMLETAGIVLGTYYLFRDVLMIERLSLLFIGPILLALNTVATYTNETQIFHKDFVVLSVLTSVFFILGFFFYVDLRKKEGDSSLQQMASTYFILGIMGTLIVTALELSGGTLVAVYAVESTVALLVGYYLYSSAQIASRLSFLFVLPVILSVEVIQNYTNQIPIFHVDFIVLSVLVLLPAALGLFFYSEAKKKSDDISATQLSKSFLYMAVFYLGALTALELDGGVLMLVYGLEAAALVLAGYYMYTSVKTVAQISLLFSVPVLVSLKVIESYVNESKFLHKDFMLLSGFVCVLAALGAFFYVQARRKEQEQTLHTIASRLLLLAVLYVGVITALELSGGMLVIAYVCEATAVLFVGYFLYKAPETVAKLSFFFAAPVLLSFGTMSQYTSQSKIFHEDFVTLLVLMVATVLIGKFLRTEYYRTQSKSLLYTSNVFLALSGVYAFTIAALELSGPVLLIAFTLEAAAVVVITRLAMRQDAVIRKASIIFAIPLLLTPDALFSDAWSAGVLHADFLALTIFASTLVLTGLFLWPTRDPEEAGSAAFDTVCGYVAGGFLYGLFLVWLVFHALFSGDVAIMLSLVVYTLLGVLLFVQGRMRDNRLLKYAGGLLIAFVLGRLLIVEVWEMQIVGRMATFFTIGVLLITTAFIGRGKGDTDSEARNDLG